MSHHHHRKPGRPASDYERRDEPLASAPVFLRRLLPALLLARSWDERELRWCLEAAFRACGWPREPDLLRDMAAWMLPHLHRKPGKHKVWGGWRLEPSLEKTGALDHGARPGQGLPLPWVLLRQAEP